VYFIQHSNKKTLLEGSDNWKFQPGLNVAKDDFVIPKIHGNAFKDTILKQEVDSHGIRNIVITGLVTNGCVRATSIAGYELGYRVILVEDGHSSYIKGASTLIQDWNRKLGQDYVDLYPASEISFSDETVN
jgi:nicotinamidase-related amidase